VHRTAIPGVHVAEVIHGRDRDLEADPLRHAGRTADGEVGDGRGGDRDAVLRPDDAAVHGVDGLNELRAGALQRAREGVNASVGGREGVVGWKAGDRVAAAEGHRADVARGDVAEGIQGGDGERVGDAGSCGWEAGDLERRRGGGCYADGRRAGRTEE